MQHFITICVLVALSQHCNLAFASWWYLGLVGSQNMNAPTQAQRNVDPRSRCSSEILSPRQQQMCRDNLVVLDIVRRGASLGIEECQNQFRHQRWNCTTFNSTNVFGKVVHFRSRETAYVYGISSAGVTWSMTRSCAKGEIPSLCGCAKRANAGLSVSGSHLNTEDSFQWGGCDDDIRYGERFARDFVDSREQIDDENKQRPTALMNLWNNEAGRRAVRASMRKACKCHGVSGSCTNKVCWNQLADFKTIGQRLKDRLDNANKLRFRNGKLRPGPDVNPRPTKKDLVYLDDSPDYCRPNVQVGIIGTSGRECNQTSSGADGCAILCCGRGFHSSVFEYVEECECKFIWCCNVQCKTCRRQVYKQYCN